MCSLSPDFHKTPQQQILHKSVQRKSRWYTRKMDRSPVDITKIMQSCLKQPHNKYIRVCLGKMYNDSFNHAVGLNSCSSHYEDQRPNIVSCLSLSNCVSTLRFAAVTSLWYSRNLRREKCTALHCARIEFSSQLIKTRESSFSSVFSVEVMSILGRTGFLLTKNLMRKRIHICSDSWAALAVLAKLRTNRFWFGYVFKCWED